jgi:predicted alpha/beta hydrolase
MEQSHSPAERGAILRRFFAVTALILAISVSDDELGTAAAVRRTLRYYDEARTSEVRLSPADLGVNAIGHFGLFHARRMNSFWIDTVRWLRDGANP